MPKVIAYLRTSTDKQDLMNQRLEILEYAHKQDLTIDEFVEIQVSSRKTPKERRIEEVFTKLSGADVLIVTELSRLGRSTAEVVGFVNTLVAENKRIIVIKQRLDISNHDINSKVVITMFSLLSELERDLISLRTKEALAAKKRQGQVLGKPRGTIQKSKFDKDLEKIKELLNLGLSVRKIAKFMGYNNHISLNTYLNKRNIKADLRSHD